MSDHPLIALIVVIAPLSLVALGGASAIYAPLQYQAVDVYHWITGREYLELFAIARVTPGPGSMLTTIVGWRIAGLAGANATGVSGGTMIGSVGRSCIDGRRASLGDFRGDWRTVASDGVPACFGVKPASAASCAGTGITGGSAPRRAEART